MKRWSNYILHTPASRWSRRRTTGRERWSAWLGPGPTNSGSPSRKLNMYSTQTRNFLGRLLFFFNMTFFFSNIPTHFSNILLLWNCPSLLLFARFVNFSYSDIECLFHVITEHFKKGVGIILQYWFIFLSYGECDLICRKINYPTDLAMTTYRDWKGWAEEEVII